jgi:hypothetical protein
MLPSGKWTNVAVSRNLKVIKFFKINSKALNILRAPLPLKSLGFHLNSLFIAFLVLFFVFYGCQCLVMTSPHTH